MNKEKNFYFEGVFYDKEADFWSAANAYADSEISPITIDRILQVMCLEISTNVLMSQGAMPMTNGQFKQLCSDMVVSFINEYRSITNEKAEIFSRPTSTTGERLDIADDGKVMSIYHALNSKEAIKELMKGLADK